MLALRDPRIALALAAFVAAGGLVVDLATPLGVAAGVVYVALVLLGMFMPWRHAVFALAAVGTALTLAGYVASDAAAVGWMAWFNRVLSVGILWTVAAFAFVRQRDAHALAKHARALEQSNAELEQFAYVASHDLQEPLRMVSSFTELLAHDYSGKLSSEADEYINFAVDGAKRMQHLIRDLLEYSRISSRPRPAAPTAAGDALTEALSNLEQTIAESDAQVDFGDLPTVACDHVRLVQVMQNLIGNAIKFRSADRRPHIRITARRLERAWEISVSDNGIGIAADYYDRIFKVFQRLHTREDYPGTGIGLAMVRKIVERYGGEIRVESTVGEGTTFAFTLPISSSDG